jgi:hypothetical protein
MAIITKTTVGLLGELGDFRAAVISEANKNFLLDAILFNVKGDLNLGHGFLKVGFHGDEYGKRQSIDPGLLLFGGAESFEAVADCLTSREERVLPCR